MKNKDLINKNYGKLFHEHLLKQYELYVNTSTDVSSKRLESNKFYLTLNSVIFGFASYLTLLNNNLIILLFSVIGFLISIIWFTNISSYKELNSAKFKVIHEMEDFLPASLFRAEEKYYLNKYRGLTAVEKFIPLIFLILYVALAIVTYFK